MHNICHENAHIWLVFSLAQVSLRECAKQLPDYSNVDTLARFAFESIACVKLTLTHTSLYLSTANSLSLSRNAGRFARREFVPFVRFAVPGIVLATILKLFCLECASIYPSCYHILREAKLLYLFIMNLFESHESISAVIIFHRDHQVFIGSMRLVQVGGGEGWYIDRDRTRLAVPHRWYPADETVLPASQTTNARAKHVWGWARELLKNDRWSVIYFCFWFWHPCSGEARFVPSKWWI